jgi:YbbR domain-containing protein
VAAFSWLRSDPSLKIASVVLAVFVWLYVRSEVRPVQVLSVPLEIEGLPDDLAVAGRTLEHVTVRVRAPEALLRDLSPGRLLAVAHLEDAQPGEHEVILGPDIVHAPMGVEVVSVDPPNLTFTLERRVSREVPVVARFRGEPRPPLRRGSYTVTPSRVTVQGPERIVRQVSQALTEEVDLGGRDRSFDSVVGLQPDRNGVRILDKPVALVKVALEEAPATRTFEEVRLVARSGAGLKARFQPETISVVLEGAGTGLSQLAAGNVQAILDLEGMSPRGAPYVVQPRIVIQPEPLGRGVTVRTISHPTVQVTVSRGGAR